MSKGNGGYTRVKIVGRTTTWHRYKVEQVCGIKLLPHNVVHHRNGDPGDNSNGNLIVCEDQAYHKLLEYRTEAYRACGDANALKCRICKQWDVRANLEQCVRRRINQGVGMWNHSKCHNLYQTNLRRRKLGLPEVTEPPGRHQRKHRRVPSVVVNESTPTMKGTKA